VVRGARKWAGHIDYQGGSVITYRPKVKLHGTNAAIHIRDGKVVAAQKRTSVLNWPHEDNAGFAAYVHNVFKPAYDQEGFGGYDYVIHGEWAGPGVQKGVAASQAPQKFFAAFAIEPTRPKETYYVTDPGLIAAIVYGGLGRKPGDYPDFHVLPWADHAVPVDIFSRGDQPDTLSADEFAARVNRLVESCEITDPWIKATFGISGTGEGYVYYPVKSTMTLATQTGLEFMFKAKGEEHRVVKSRDAATVAPLTDSNLISLVEKLVTEARLKQGLQEALGGEADTKRMGEFLKWVGNDVEKECMAEIADSGFDWKTASKQVTRVAATWLKQKSREEALA
jgi:hypothetical protein